MSQTNASHHPVNAGYTMSASRILRNITLLSALSFGSLLSSSALANDSAQAQNSADMDAFNAAYDQLADTPKILSAPSAKQKQAIRDLLSQAGMTAPVTSIEPSKLPSMYQITLGAQGGQPQPPLHITADGQYILQGGLRPNPSPQKSTPPTESPSQTLSGTPVSDALRKSLMANTSLLKNITPDVSFYYTSIPGVIWGITVEGTPFLTNTDASVFNTEGEISLIKNGQFAGLDLPFEQTKNQYILSKLNEEELIVYPATTDEKAVIYVATDINCPYCRIMHKDMDKLNSQGITVKVIGFPVYPESKEPMRKLWCETGQARKQAFDAAMNGLPVSNYCDGGETNNLAANQQLAAGLVVAATPAIYREDGMPFNGPYNDPRFSPFLGIN